jgi:predicted nucleic acid-binding protein
MSPHRSFVDERCQFVADASVWINIIAGGRAAEILRALERPAIIPRIALDELERGREKGRSTAREVTKLAELGLVEVAELPPDAEAIFLTLVIGNASETLDDGEAATLAHASQIEGIAMIDERKASALGGRRFPQLSIISTTDLFLSSVTRAVLGEEALVDVLHSALKEARMRVPDHLLSKVCHMLGPVRTADCSSLPARVRLNAPPALGLAGAP